MLPLTGFATVNTGYSTFAFHSKSSRANHAVVLHTGTPGPLSAAAHAPAAGSLSSVILTPEQVRCGGKRQGTTNLNKGLSWEVGGPDHVVVDTP